MRDDHPTTAQIRRTTITSSRRGYNCRAWKSEHFPCHAIVCACTPDCSDRLRSDFHRQFEVENSRGASASQCRNFAGFSTISPPSENNCCVSNGELKPSSTCPYRTFIGRWSAGQTQLRFTSSSRSNHARGSAQIPPTLPFAGVHPASSAGINIFFQFDFAHHQGAGAEYRRLAMVAGIAATADCNKEYMHNRTYNVRQHHTRIAQGPAYGRTRCTSAITRAVHRPSCAL